MADVNEKIKNLNVKSLKIRTRKKEVEWEGEKWFVREPSYRMTEQTQSMEAGDVALFLVHGCAVDKNGERIFNGGDYEELKDLPVSLVSALAAGVVSFINPDSVEAVRGNSDSTPADS